MGLSKNIVGGGNRLRCMDITDAATPTSAGTVLLDIVDDIISTDGGKQASGAWNPKVEHVQDDAILNTYLEGQMSVSTSGGIEGLTQEDGVKRDATTSQNATQLFISRGGSQGTISTNARKVLIAPVRLANVSGSYKQEGEKYNRVTLEYEGFRLSGAFTVPASFFNSIMTTPVTVALSASFPYGRVAFG